MVRTWKIGTKDRLNWIKRSRSKPVKVHKLELARRYRRVMKEKPARKMGSIFGRAPTTADWASDVLRSREEEEEWKGWALEITSRIEQEINRKI